MSWRKASTPDSSTPSMVTPSEPGAPRFARTSPQALARMSLRATLSYRAWNRRLGSCLALRYSTRCRARNFSSLSAFLVDLALIGHSPDPLPVRPCAGEAGALRSGRVVLSQPSSLLRPPPTPSRPPATSRALVIGGPASRAADPGPRRASPVPTTPFRPFHAPCAGGFVGTRSRIFGAVRGLRPPHMGSAPPWPRSRGGKCDDGAGFASCCGPVGCSTPLRTRPLDHARGLSYRGPWRLPGPDFHRLAAVSLSLGYAVLLLLSLWSPNCWTHEGCIYSDRPRDQRVSFEAGLAWHSPRGRARKTSRPPGGFGILHPAVKIADPSGLPCGPP